MRQTKMSLTTFSMTTRSEDSFSPATPTSKRVCILLAFPISLCQRSNHMSMYRQISMSKFSEDYSKNTVYRFLNDAKINRIRFMITLATSVLLVISKLDCSSERMAIFFKIVNLVVFF